MTTIAPSYEDQASAFAAAVRSSLADLSEAELDELLDGLEADLLERLADGGELGDADAYADELRNAAGLPASDAASGAAKKKLRASLRDTRISTAARVRTFWAATPARQAVRDFVLSLTPLWWVVRGVVLAWIMLAPFGRGLGLGVVDPFAVAVGAAAIVVSVQWGRGKWLPKAWLVVLRKVGSFIAAALLLPFIVVATSALAAPNYVYVDDYAQQGLASNGEQITNVFAFDCLGQPIDAVQLFDQNGLPILTHPEGDSQYFYGWDEERQQNIRYDRNSLAAYAGLENVYPLQEARAATHRDPDSVKPKDAEWPIESTLPLSPSCPTGEASTDDAPTDEGAADEAAPPRSNDLG